MTGTIFGGKKNPEYKILFFFYFFYKFCLKYFSFSEEFSEILSRKYTRFHVMYPQVLSDINQTLIFSTYFRNTQITNFMKIRSVGTELFQAYRQR